LTLTRSGRPGIVVVLMAFVVARLVVTSDRRRLVGLLVGIVVVRLVFTKLGRPAVVVLFRGFVVVPVIVKR